MSAVPDDPADPLLGTMIGDNYEIVRLIGRGGVGLVYLAHDLDGRQVVVKLLAPDSRSEDAIARFEREAKRLGSVRHPNIVEMLDSGHTSGRAYLVMEYLEGDLLSSYVSTHGRLTLHQFVPIAAQILKGLGHAHSRELMVRDIKPANIMLCQRKGRANFVKLLDFGLAKLLKDDTRVTEEHVLGTVGYLAPEAIRGEELDLRVDVYALGALFFYMLSGQLPFDGGDAEAMFYKTLHEEPPSMDDLLGPDHGIPRGLLALIRRCLHKDREERPADANALVEELIDVVPAALFRLPRAKPATKGVPRLLPPGAGNTGMMELVGPAAKSGPHPIVPRMDSAALVAVNSSLPAPEDPLPSQATLPASPEAPLASAPAAQNTGLGRTVAIGAVVAAVVALGLVFAWPSNDEDGVATAAVSGPAPSTRDQPAEKQPNPTARLEAAEALIGKQAFDEAALALDEVRAAVADAPSLRGRLDRADRNILIGRLLASAAAFEHKREDSAARSAYQDILAIDPAHSEARAGLARLVDTPAEPAAEDVTPTSFVIRSSPLANVIVDGKSQGTTPFSGELSEGEHRVRLTARGHRTWSGRITVQAAENDPLVVKLARKGSGASSKADPVPPDPAETGPAVEPATPTPPTKPEPTPATKPEPKPTPKPEPKSGGVFLPTPKSGDGQKGVFLPTKD